jgi:hypothetical protein
MRLRTLAETLRRGGAIADSSLSSGWHKRQQAACGHVLANEKACGQANSGARKHNSMSMFPLLTRISAGDPHRPGCTRPRRTRDGTRACCAVALGTARCSYGEAMRCYAAFFVVRFL